MKNNLKPIVLFAVFLAVAVILWLTLDNIFFLFNFVYIGGCVSLGLLLYLNHYRYARLLVQLGVGLYMLVYLGLYCRENMQLEGFWYFLFLGVFEAAVIHYLVAKIAGPFLFGRGWCGYACWTAMVLDLLPYKIVRQPAKDKLRPLRYLMFLGSLVFVAGLFLFNAENKADIMFISFIAGNVLYYAAGIVLAVVWRDNRAFCKYFCPITVFLKPASYFALMRIKVNTQKCVKCGKCKRVCPMEVDMLDNRRCRKNATECILCMACISICPHKAITM